MAETQPSNDRPSDVKSCTSCGLDVTNRKRTKDAQGRYFCEDCVAKAKAARAAANPPPQIKANKDAVASASKAGGDDNAFLLDMGGSAMAIKGSTPCPECSRALTEGTVICTGCGYNLQTGKRLAVKVTKAKAAKGEGAAGGDTENILENGFALAMLGIIFTVGAIGLGFMMPEFRWIQTPVQALYWLSATIALVVSAFRSQQKVWGGALIAINATAFALFGVAIAVPLVAIFAGLVFLVGMIVTLIFALAKCESRPAKEFYLGYWVVIGVATVITVLNRGLLTP
jgi:hypothetical protein